MHESGFRSYKLHLWLGVGGDFCVWKDVYYIEATSPTILKENKNQPSRRGTAVNDS